MIVLLAGMVLAGLGMVMGLFYMALMGNRVAIAILLTSLLVTLLIAVALS